jgi:hypothetical protein
MRIRRRRTPATTRPFPTYLETAEQTIARLEREQATYVARHARMSA